MTITKTKWISNSNQKATRFINATKYKTTLSSSRVIVYCDDGLITGHDKFSFTMISYTPHTIYGHRSQDKASYLLVELILTFVHCLLAMFVDPFCSILCFPMILGHRIIILIKIVNNLILPFGTWIESGTWIMNYYYAFKGIKMSYEFNWIEYLDKFWIFSNFSIFAFKCKTESKRDTLFIHSHNISSYRFLLHSKSE